MTEQLAFFPTEPNSQGVWMTPEQTRAFDIFWDKFGHKYGKADAQRAWVKNWDWIELILERVFRAAEMEAVTKLPEGQTRKWAQGWINSRRCLDERFDKPKIVKQRRDWAEEEWRADFEENNSEWYLKHCASHYDLPDAIKEEYGI